LDRHASSRLSLDAAAECHDRKKAMTDPRDERLEQFARALLQAQDLAARLHAQRSRAGLAQARLATVEQSIAFRLGACLVAASKSLRGLLSLPVALAALLRELPGRSTPVQDPSPPSDLCAIPLLPGAELTTEWAAAIPKPAPASLAELRIAAVMDEFTRSCFAPDCQLLEVAPAGFEARLEEFAPHLLFVESAWRGKDGNWMHKVQPLSPELVYLVDFCRRRGIPTVFWNKEDPSHFDGFLDAARLFDHVFTTDSDCIPAYRQALGHDRVYVLSFGCQPRVHHPVESHERKDAACFAGSWYERYPERARDFAYLVDAVSQVMPVEIYDRNHHRGDPAFAFPARYRPMIKGALPYDRIDEAYKGYRFAITVNTVKTSPTMFARRVYELLACNTVTVSNDALGLARTLGDRVVCEGDKSALVARLEALQASTQDLHRLRLRGLREVLEKHTAAHRLAEMAGPVLGGVAHVQPQVEVLARVGSTAEAAALIETHRGQRWPHTRLHLVVPASVAASLHATADAGITILDEAAAGLLKPARVWAGRWLALWHPADHYGRCYLTDLMLATAYAGIECIGKGRYFEWEDDRVVERGARPYHAKSPLWLRASIVPATIFPGASAQQLLDRLESEAQPGLIGLAVDEFNYCRHGGTREMACVDTDNT
jgi:spore maturation protein CgeB